MSDEDTSNERFRGRPHFKNPAKPLVSVVSLEKLRSVEVRIERVDSDGRILEEKTDTFENQLGNILQEELVAVSLDSIYRVPIHTKRNHYKFRRSNPNGDLPHIFFLLECYLLLHHQLHVWDVTFNYFDNTRFFLSHGHKILVPEHELFSHAAFEEGFLERYQGAWPDRRYMYKRFYEDTEVGQVQRLDLCAVDFFRPRFWVDPNDWEDFPETRESIFQEDGDATLRKLNEKVDRLGKRNHTLLVLIFIALLALLFK